MLRTKARGAAAAALCVVIIISGAVAAGISRSDAEVAQLPALEIIVKADGSEQRVLTSQATVGEALEDAGISLGSADYVIPSPNTKLRAGMTVRVVRVTEKVIVEEQPIGFKTRKQPTNSLRVGLTQVVEEGKRGLKNVYYRVRYEDGVEKSRSVIRSEVVQQPQDRLILFGERGALASRGWFVSRKVLIMHATAYDPGPRSCGRYASGRTSTGMRAGYGVVAVDPRIIKLGTKLYIEGYGFAIAGDRGSAIKGNRIDLGFDTYREAARFGRKTVKVHILD